MKYEEFIWRKSQAQGGGGIEPIWMPPLLFPFQQDLVVWALKKGRAAIYADCGLGKTPCQLAWAENIVRHTNGRVLVLTPLAVGAQTVQEGAKFGVEAVRSRDGRIPAQGIVVTNYEKLHLFNPADFAGVVCDESSILKHFSGATQKGVTRFMAKIPYRLLCTATAAPNDYSELGTSSEALGELGHSDMLTRFFREVDQKPHRLQDVKDNGRHWQEKAGREQRLDLFAKVAYRAAQQMAGRWRLKGHAVEPFWRWVCSWARACRKPSDLGYDDGAFILPELTERVHVVRERTAPDGMLFSIPSLGLAEEREARRRTIGERCEAVAQLVSHAKPAVVWCHLNAEGDRLEKIIPDARQVCGSQPDEEREEIYRAFAGGDLRVVVVKPKIGAWGLNWQHCAHVVTFATHSYEQHYQAVRRCWRFGQMHPVRVDIVSLESEQAVMANLARKAESATIMFERLVAYMNESLGVQARQVETHVSVEVPAWIR